MLEKILEKMLEKMSEKVREDLRENMTGTRMLYTEYCPKTESSFQDVCKIPDVEVKDTGTFQGGY
jgi:hypothetical protein